ncbi:hypothetical protein SK128_018248 [Halocaridina rubra]|uniref:Uncharacterized protein n=1 Tax=Halocaridina rubra TaxID=373956 RepID=A0AAN9A210_HALRR
MNIGDPLNMWPILKSKILSVEIQHHHHGAVSSSGHALCGSSGTTSTNCPRPLTFQAGGVGGRGPLPAAPISREQLEPFLAALAALQKEQHCSNGDASDSSSLDNLSCEVLPPTTPQTSLESLQERIPRLRPARVYHGHASDGPPVAEANRHRTSRRGPHRASWCNSGIISQSIAHQADSPVLVEAPHPPGESVQVALGTHLVTFQATGGSRSISSSTSSSCSGVGEDYPSTSRRSSQHITAAHLPQTNLKKTLQEPSLTISSHAGKFILSEV